MKKILCPTDFSDISQNAIAYAAKFSKATGSMLTLLNVQPAPSPGLRPEKELVINTISERLQEIAKEVRQFFKISCETDLTESARLLSDTITEKSTNFDLIIMGTNGAEDLTEFFTGSNTYHAIRKSKTPVILIPSSCIYSDIKDIVYSYNYLGERKLPMKQLVPWIKILKCNLTVLQVTEEAVSQDVDDEMKELQFILGHEWRQEGLQLNFDSVRSSEIASAINSYMHRNDKEVLALCTVHRNFLAELFHKSVIKIISEIASYPVFVYHE